ncbi:glycosyltransferase family 4 protein [Flavobacterium sedimenticola]|uniref:Glycosyltransferase family 4 protein n=1 Tax=Flavobacterium sedimenticola TaxID=3043286 RepID=A0ABT6XQH7_9FLAO|nr:glycosyltransferase family 4 protein [Flavobacterium sedimenticola]MDI9257336.1 glycosyltransferase family 4 protein [Flavobacterium sedimenticola]
MAEPKKLLIITYYWPPAGGPGVQRWLKFVKYLPDYHIQPIVYIPENPTYPIVDSDLESEVSEKAIILKNKIFEPYGLASLFGKNKTRKISSGIIPNQKKQTLLEKFLLWIRGNIFIPDARCFWVNPSVKFLKKYIQENNIDTVVTSGPPHSLHLIGLQLKKELGLHWLADFRDPWTTIGYHKALKLSSYAEKKHKALEQEVLTTADTIIVTSKTTKAEFEAITQRPIAVITNGYDTENIVRQPLDEKFTLAHIGSFLSERNPRILWKALKELTKEHPDFRKDFQLKLIGAVSREVLDTIAEFKLDEFVMNLGYISHSEAVAHQRKSQVLLLIEIDSEDTKSIIPGKLFEYLVSERPIVAIGPEGSDFAEIITTTNTGVFFTYDEKERLKDVLLKYYQEYQKQNLKVHAVGLQQYSRKSLTEKLSKLVTRNS